MPLVTDSQGHKFGKSEGNALWLDKEKTSSYQLYQFFLNVEDSMVIDYLKIYTFLSKEEIEELEVKNNEHPELREAHKALAREIITFLHGKEEYEKAVNLAEHLFSNKFQDLSKKDIEDLFKNQDIKEIEDVLLDIEKKNKSIKEMRDILTDARNKYKEMMKLNKEIEEGKKKEDILDKEFHELKEELGVCPLCGGELK